MVSQHPHTYIIAESAQDNPEESQDFFPDSQPSPTWADPDIGFSTKAFFKTHEDSDGVVKETLVVSPKKDYHHLTPENAYNASHSRSAKVGPSLSTRKSNARKAKEYIWGGPGRQVVRLILTLPSIDTYENYHPQGIEGVENDRSCRAATMKTLKLLRKDLEEKGGCIHGVFGGVEYTKAAKAHINLVMDIHHPSISDFPDMKDFLNSHFKNALISKNFIKVIEENHPMPASIFTSTVEVQKVERPGYSFSDALNGALEYVTKTDRHYSKGYQQNPNDNIPHNHKGCKFISDFSGLRHGVTREDLPADVNPYKVVEQLAAVCDEEGWVGHNNAPGEWVVQRTIPAEPKPEPDSPKPEPETDEPETPEPSPWLSTKVVDLTHAIICEPYKTDTSVNLITVKRVAFQYLLTRDGTETHPVALYKPLNLHTHTNTHDSPARASVTPCRPIMSLSDALAPTAHHDAHIVSQMLPTAPVAHIDNQMKLTAAHAAPSAPSVLQRPRDSTMLAPEDDDPPP